MPTKPSSEKATRIFAGACFVAIVAWLSVVIGIATVNLVSRPWCSAGTPCEEMFWARLIPAALGGVGGFVLCGYALLNASRARTLALSAIAALVLTAASGAWFLPILSG